MWKTLKHVLPSKKYNNILPHDLTPDDFNSYFTSVGEKLSSHFDKNQQPVMPPVVGSGRRFTFSEVSPNFVFKSLKNLSVQSSIDILGMDRYLLRLAASHMFLYITYLFNLSLSTGFFPSDWKLASIMPIFKGAGSKSDPSNYRPISITSTISKIFESAIKVQIMQYFQDHSIITPHQSAYLHGRSTQTALHSVIDTLSSNMNDGSVSAVFAMDMAKGFDTIPHRLLLHKLSYYGFGHLVQVLLIEKNTNCQRVQYCLICVPISIGVHQGSILGPLLFILYINDLPSIFNDCHCQMYADDTTLYCNADLPSTFNDCHCQMYADDTR